MMGLHQRLHPCFQHVSVNLGGADISMTEHRLDRAQIRTTRQQVGREGVAENVRRYRRKMHPALGRKRLKQLVKALPGKMPTASARRKQKG